MKTTYRLMASAAFAASLAFPGLALAAETGNAHNPVGPLPSQRYSVNGSEGQGAALVVDASGVREVQQALNRLGYDAGPITGIWDKGTQRAMAQFQEAHGLVPNGDMTLSAIAGLGLWQNVIGNPNGNGNKPLVAMASNGAPQARGEGGGGVSATGGGAGGSGQSGGSGGGH
jgi:peptidoglycan hydrolase-like protein with peptidoglycan-binding domain